MELERANARPNARPGGPVETVGDFFRQAERFGMAARAPDLGRDIPIMSGRNGILQLRPGLRLHFSESIDLKDLTIETECPPNIGVKIFLSGSVDARIGGVAIPMPRPSRGGQSWEPVAVLLSQPRTERFIRSTSRGTRLRKVTVSFTREWLRGNGVIDETGWEAIARFATCHLAMRTWLPSAAAVSACEQIIAAPALPPVLLSLYMESRALILVEEGLKQLVPAQGSCGNRDLRAHDLQRLMAVDAFLNRHCNGPISSAQLAAHAATSANTLRRLVRAAHGLSLLEYVRRRRLELARAALERGASTIAEVAHAAGYGSAANFSTAFKRYFGVSPGQLRQRTGGLDNGVAFEEDC